MLSGICVLGKKVLSGIFTGCAWYAGGIRKGDILVADIEELHNFHASKKHFERLNAKEVLLPKQGDTCAFPCADGSIKLAGKDHEVRTTDQSRGHSEHGEGRRGAHQGEADDPPLQNSKKHKMSWEPGTTSEVFWEFYFPSSRSTRSKILCVGRKFIPNPAQKIDVVKRTNTTLDVLQESQIDDFWGVDGDRELSGPWTVFTQF